MFDPKKPALIHTTVAPIHIITKIDVIMVCWDYAVRKAKVVDNNRQSKNGPHKSPTFLSKLLHSLNFFLCFSIFYYFSAGITAYLSFVIMFWRSLFYSIKILYITKVSKTGYVNVESGFYPPC